jgi:hypothetical protein
MRKLIAGTALALSVISIGGTAMAGETTGGPNPKPTAVDDHHAGSICSFSGLNDVPGGDIDPRTGQIDPLSVGKVQNWGTTKNIVKAQVNEATGGHGAAAIVGDMHAFGPGVSCNGSGE